jgi:GH15 family glucan-1,4-alpha-glucosidase
VDWLCLHRFDSPSLFGALLDREKGGRFQVRPVGVQRVERRYVGPTPVLETTFHTDGGVVRLTDAMPVASEDAKARQPWPEHQLVRRVECLEGSAEVRILLQPRPDYGRELRRLEDRGPSGIWCQNGDEAMAVLTDLPLSIPGDEPWEARGSVRMEAGEVGRISLTYGAWDALILLPPSEVDRLLEQTEAWWAGWAARCTYDGPWSEMVVRSAITLKLMTFAPSGAVVAAPTTSLPEAVGHGRNWDYRFCWLRDASWTLRALFDLGYPDDARAFFDWLVHASRRTAPDIRILYDLHGRSSTREDTLDHLSGWKDSRPVRVGNAAADQLQLDVYGEVIAAAYEYIQQGETLDEGEIDLLVGLGETVCRRWPEPDEGIWEVRGGRRHHTYSKVMCATALDQLLVLHEQGHLDQIPAERFETNRDMLRDELESRGCCRDEPRVYTATYEGDDLDAALLRLPMTGYIQAGDERMVRTLDAILEELGQGDGLLLRYPHGHDGLEGREGAFALCTFWAVEALALADRDDEAVQLFEQMLDHANDLGLYAEQIDPETGSFRGNFPQAFTHLGLVNAALTLARCQRARRGEGTRPWGHDEAPRTHARDPIRADGESAEDARGGAG